MANSVQSASDLGEQISLSKGTAKLVKKFVSRNRCDEIG